MHALRSIHGVLDHDAILVDTQPVSARPPVGASSGVELGTLDMREWAKTIRAVDELILSTAASGLYELRHESYLVVTDTYESGDEFLEIVGAWAGTRIPRALAQRVPEATPPITVRQKVRLRLFAPRRSRPDVMAAADAAAKPPLP